MAKKVVITGGGTGMWVVLNTLRDFDLDLAAVVPMVASGGSTGRLRDDLGVASVGHFRQVLMAMSDRKSIVRDMINYRFSEGELSGHNFGNIYLAALEKITGSLDLALEHATKQLRVKGKVLPLTSERTDICFELENGALLCGEKNMSKPTYDKSLSITKIFLEPIVSCNPSVIEEVLSADYIILGPGDFYFILSSLLIDGFKDALIKTSAKKIFICNIMNRDGLTNDYRLKDYIEQIETFIGKDCLDHIVYNTQSLPSELQVECVVNEESFVEHFAEDELSKNYNIIKADLIHEKIHSFSNTNDVAKSCIRHDKDKLANILKEIII